jgi:hypothetical protein
MFPVRNALLGCALLIATAAGQNPRRRTAAEYFPLQTGNQWLYRCSANCSAADTWTVAVVGTAPITAPDGSPYYVVQGFGRDYWVRLADGSRLVARNPKEDAKERLWYDFSAPEDEEYATSVHPCNVSARITSRNFKYSGPLGDFAGLRIEYPASTCDLQGLVEEIFLPRIGLARRVDLVPGSRTYDLIYARVGGRDIVPRKELAFSLTLDRAVYSIGFPNTSPVVTARMTLKNTTSDTLHLTFPVHPYDLEIKNDKDEIIYRWSDGKVFPAVVTELDLSPGEQSYVITVPLETDFARTWPPGTYTAEVRLNTTPPGLYLSRVSFEIRWVR